MNVILLFLAKPLDKHGITLVSITYPPLRFSTIFLPQGSEFGTFFVYGGGEFAHSKTSPGFAGGEEGRGGGDVHAWN